MSDIDIFLLCDVNKQVLEALCIEIVEESIISCPFLVFENCDCIVIAVRIPIAVGIVIYFLSETHVC